MNALPTHRLSFRHAASAPAALIALLIASGPGGLPLAAAAPATVGWRDDSLSPNDSWNTLALEVSVKRRHVDAAGTTIGVPVPEVTYQLERSMNGAGWRTVFTSTFATAVPSRPADAAAEARVQAAVLANVPSTIRIEDDEDGTPLRVFDSAGRPLPLLHAPIDMRAQMAFRPPRSTGRQWIEALLVTATGSVGRQNALERRYGRATRVAGLQRYVRVEDGVEEEVLATNVMNLTTAITLRKDGRTTHRRTFTYGPPRRGYYARTGVRSESAVDPDATEFAVVDTTFSNIRLERRQP